MAAQRQYKPDDYAQQHRQDRTQIEPKYQEFYELDTQSAKLRELLFFSRIALFSISAVLLSFLFLSIGLGTLPAFALAILLAIAITSTVSTFVLSMRKKDD